jgi:aspartate/methionine/tyrosine aminotransferase
MGVAVPLPLQYAASVAWSDEEHSQIARNAYKQNFALSEAILGLQTPQATFYHWLEVANGEEFAKKLWQEMGVQVLPGAYLSRGDIGDNYVRLALVYDSAQTKESLERIKIFINKGNN